MEWKTRHQSGCVERETKRNAAVESLKTLRKKKRDDIKHTHQSKPNQYTKFTKQGRAESNYEK